MLYFSSLYEKIGHPYLACGYRSAFFHWIYTDDPPPYNSYSNGAAMRVSGCGYVGKKY